MRFIVFIIFFYSLSVDARPRMYQGVSSYNNEKCSVEIKSNKGFKNISVKIFGAFKTVHKNKPEKIYQGLTTSSYYFPGMKSNWDGLASYYKRLHVYRTLGSSKNYINSIEIDNFENPNIIKLKNGSKPRFISPIRYFQFFECRELIEI